MYMYGDRILQMAIGLASISKYFSEYCENEKAEEDVDDNIIFVKDGADLIKYEHVDADGAEVYNMEKIKGKVIDTV